MIKKFLILTVLAFFVFGVNGYSGFETLRGPTVFATTDNVDGHDSFITEIYNWDTTSASYQLEDRFNAHIALRVPVHALAIGKGYLSLYSAGDLHRYSSAYHPPEESAAFVWALEGDAETRVRVASGWGPLFLCGNGYMGLTVTAEGTLITDTSNKYELRGKGKLDNHSGGESGSVGPVGGGTSGTSGTGVWVPNITSFRVSVVEFRPSPPSTSPSTQGDGTDGSSSSSSPGCSNNPDYDYCTDTGTCSTRSGSGVPGECGHNYCCCAPYGSPEYNDGSSDDSSSDDGSSGSSCSQSDYGDYCDDQGSCTSGSEWGVSCTDCGENACNCPSYNGN